MTICAPIPDPLINGNTADATQVMADLQQIINNVNANAAENGVNSSITQLTGLTGNPLVQTGVVQDYIGSAAPSGYVLADGLTIGDATSGATERANADTLSLFTLLWNSMANAQAPVSGGRGASAAADFAAHKTITLPDLRGRVVIGKDDMGGSAANRVTNAVSGVAGTTLGAAGGDQNAQLHGHGITDGGHGHGTTDPGHGHGITDPGHVHTNVVTGANANAVGAASAVFQNSPQNTNSATTGISINGNTTGLTVSSNTTGITVNNSGTGASQNVQPSYVLNKIIKL